MGTSRRWLVPGLAAVGVIGALTLSLIWPGQPQTTPSQRGTAATSQALDSRDPLTGTGSTSYDVSSYRIDLTWDEKQKRIDGRVEIKARATLDITELPIDFYGSISSATVDGAPAKVSQSDQSRWLLSSAQIAGGKEFTVGIDYTSFILQCPPQTVTQSRTETVIAGEPEGPACWFPGNDHPSDPATYDVTLNTKPQITGVSAGSLAEQSPGRARYVITHPTPTYATLVTFGSYEVTRQPFRNGTSSYAIASQVNGKDEIRYRLSETPKLIEGLEKFLGPYPADAAGAVVTATNLSVAALETSGSPLYRSTSTQRGVIVHELAHMWFGNRVTLRTWQDIWINEAMASYASWVYDDDAQSRFDHTLKEWGGDQEFWKVDLHHPSRDQLFTLVYSRGPMSLHALRNVMGDDKFFPMWRDWAQQQGPHGVDDFIAHAEKYHGSSLSDFFKAWLDGTDNMPRTPEYGFR